MRQLKFVSLSEDGASLVLEADPDGERFTLPIDERLRAASRGDLARLGQIEIELDSPLRPRDIQARVRAGESPEQLSNSTKMPLERVLRFAYPVLQEREQITAEARRSRIRRGEGPAQRTLGELVDERLLARGVEPDSVTWDSWRREDGAWTVVARWRESGRGNVATWSFKLSARSATAADDQATELTSDKPARRISPVTPLALASQQISPEPPARTRSVQQVPRHERRRDSVVPGTTRTRRSPRVPVPPLEPAAHDEDRAKRARVPSWDDILLGVRKRN